METRQQWTETFSQLSRKGVLLNEHIFNETFQDVVNKAFDKEMGYGYISDYGGCYNPDARVILQGKNPFLDNHSVTFFIISNTCSCEILYY